MKRILYLGSDPSHFSPEGELTHYPLIKIVPCAAKNLFANWLRCTHLILTSKHGVRLFAERLRSGRKKTLGKEIIAVGQVTAYALEKEGLRATLVSREETQEGIISLLEKRPPRKSSYFLLPRSSRSRSVLTDYLKAAGYAFEAVDLYDTLLQKPGPIPDLNQFDEIVFTSPSTVKGFQALKLEIPVNMQLTAIGPVTEKVLKKALNQYHQVRNTQGDKNVSC
ncbi:MAG: hypothetical protein K940chlam2_00495 [Chlamydiae bacterium]|nr:hypothetical protein [Chlamydiota bacterium]